MKRKVLSLILALVLCLSLTAPVMAADSDFMIENGVLTAYNGSGGDVVVPDGVTEIKSYVFKDCSGLTSVTTSAKWIGSMAFYNCTNMASVTLLLGVVSIDANAFGSCPSLKNVTIPASVTGIHDGAFMNCPSLTDVYFGGTEEEWAKL